MKDDSAVSKTQRKREMHALQSLGEELVQLTPEQVAALDLPDRLRDAVLEVRHITKWGARRRQIQYVGRLMRDVDAAQIRDRLGASRAASARQTARFHQAERWRARLLDDDSALADFLSSHPSADAKRLQSLLRDAHREAQAQQSKRSFRALFQAIQETMDAVQEKS